MVNIKLSQIYLYHLVRLTDKNKADIRLAIDNAEVFAMAGTQIYPIVEFLVEQDVYETTPECYANEFNVKYGVIPNGVGGFDIILPLFEDYIDTEDDVNEQDCIPIQMFNTYAPMTPFTAPSFVHPYHPDATHAVEFLSLAGEAYCSPWKNFRYEFALHYLFNEFNSNRRCHIDDYDYDAEVEYRVVRFASTQKDGKCEYYANIYEHTPDGGSFHSRNFLFRRVNERDVFFCDTVDF